MIKLEGRLLSFGTINKNLDVFDKTCDIDISEKIPLCWNFEHMTPIGVAEVSRDDKGLICKAEIFPNVSNNIDINDILSDGKIGVGGFYTNIKKHEYKNLTIIDAAVLKEVSLTLAPVSDDYYLEIIKEENKDD